MDWICERCISPNVRNRRYVSLCSCNQSHLWSQEVLLLGVFWTYRLHDRISFWSQPNEQVSWVGSIPKSCCQTALGSIIQAICLSLKQTQEICSYSRYFVKCISCANELLTTYELHRHCSDLELTWFYEMLGLKASTWDHSRRTKS